jgi:hypothetical protein
VPNVLVMNADTAAAAEASAACATWWPMREANPGRLNYGSGGNGSAGHLAGEMFKTQAGVFIVHIPYAGGNPAQLGLLSGQVDLNFDNLASASANIRAGKLKALAVTTAARASAMPDLPTVAEAGRSLGLGQFDIGTWFGLFGPAGLPPDVLAKLNKGFSRRPGCLQPLQFGQRVGVEEGAASSNTTVAQRCCRSSGRSCAARPAGRPPGFPSAWRPSGRTPAAPAAGRLPAWRPWRSRRLRHQGLGQALDQVGGKFGVSQGTVTRYGVSQCSSPARKPASGPG